MIFSCINIIVTISRTIYNKYANTNNNDTGNENNKIPIMVTVTVSIKLTIITTQHNTNNK